MKIKTIMLKSNYFKEPYLIDYIENGKGLITEAFYFLDGQNVFLDQNATYKRSLRAAKHLKKLKRNYVAFAIYSSHQDEERLDLLSPFKITNSYLPDYQNKTTVCEIFTKELLELIIPTLEKNYQIKTRSLIGSSLAASYAIYLNSKVSLFQNLALFSAANFIFENELYNYLETHPFKNELILVAVGKKEQSDGCYNEKLYLETASKYYNYLQTKGIPSLLYRAKNGKHNEASWEKYLKYFIKQLTKKKLP